MTKNFFEELEASLPKNRKARIVIALAANKAVSEAISKAFEMDLISEAILVDSLEEINSVYPSIADDKRYRVINATNEMEAISKAIEEAKNGNAEIVLKGNCKSSNLLKALFHRSDELEHGLISHITAFELPNSFGVKLLTDSAVNIGPNVKQLCNIIENAKAFFNKYVNRPPKVALLAANEKVSEKVPSTTLGKETCGNYANREDLIVEGPLSFDLAISAHSAEIKHYQGKIQGDADILVAPRIETANALYKSLHHYVHANMGAVTYGGQWPVVHPSRGDNTETNYNSILLALSLI